MKTKKPKVEWDGHGTDVDVKNPGTYWRGGNVRIFTPAPHNNRSEAQAFADNQYRHNGERAYTVSS